MNFWDEDEFDEIAHEKTEALCDQCNLDIKANTKQMKMTGEGQLSCLIVGEGPGPKEDQLGEQWVGRVGQYFRMKLRRRGLELDRDFFKINAVNCIPWDDEQKNFRKPNDFEVAACRPYVNQIVKETNPKFIWLMGDSAIEYFLGQSFSDLRVATWRGYCIPDARTGSYILPMFHPSYAARSIESKEPHIEVIFERDLDHAIDCLQGNNLPPFLPSDYDEGIHSLFNFEDVKSLLDMLIQNPPEFLFFDYEATGLKPFAPGHKIISISLAFDCDNAYSFPYMYRNHFNEEERKEIRKLWKQILRNQKIRKIAQNVPFEKIWTGEIFKIEVANWSHCTCIGSHVLDTRYGVTGLTFQTYKNFGIRPYDKEIDPYKKSPNANAFNNIEGFPLDKLLYYGGQDSFFGMNLYDRQLEEFEYRHPDLWDAYQFYFEGSLVLADMTLEGINVIEQYYHDKMEETKQKIADMKNDFMKLPIVKEFEDAYQRLFDFNSDKDKQLLFYEIGGAEKVETKKGNLSISKKSLANIESKRHVKLYQEIQRTQKVLDTYLSGIVREVCNGKINPFIHLNTVRTLRSSSSNPNFQNVPEHDEESMVTCKQGVVPSKGNWILAWDFGRIEVCTGCFYHFDPQMIKYVTDAGTDMHRDAAMDILILPQDEMTKDIRFHFGKNGWVFPQFYGDYYGNCVVVMWREVKKLKLNKTNITVKEHLQKVFNSDDPYDAFMEHCKGVERKFWEERFKVYGQWRKDIYEEYLKTGIIKTLFGFELTGILSRNDCANHGIQGTAFHLLLWTLIQLAKIWKERKWKSKMIFQIHDSGLVDLYPPERDEIISTIWKIGTQDMPKALSWINVPMEIDFEISKKNWAEKEAVKQTKLEEILRSQNVI